LHLPQFRNSRLAKSQSSGQLKPRQIYFCKRSKAFTWLALARPTQPIQYGQT